MEVTLSHTAGSAGSACILHFKTHFLSHSIDMGWTAKGIVIPSLPKPPLITHQPVGRGERRDDALLCNAARSAAPPNPTSY